MCTELEADPLTRQPKPHLAEGSSVSSGAADNHWELSLRGTHLILQPESNDITSHAMISLPNGHQPLMW
ncbi:hypothetical protein C4D60_Mb04t06880 [Musa balbisiana]|uniref:Uncharacterized protein n=1 Tax=Musa balbisiana TaxID=52838 RepID=A0A4S8KA69_MUSBA|nr:hypothetical protein C4D60_Mb04t06880 [Musa balbisiana]